jgi:2-polyprenyl-3-methyl-5-hydroxy-6-metoxy-1,4-benzoquinol methylase
MATRGARSQCLYDEPRPEMVPYIPDAARQLLDVGCAQGHFAQALRERNPSAVLWGIDPEPHGDGRPNPYDTRLVGEFPAAIPPGIQFDCIVFNDVLEHMVDPWAALRSARTILELGGSLVASLPNVRHVSVIRPLVLRGDWRYQDSGILDRNHLRFFTRSTISDLFETTGFRVMQLDPIRVATRGRLAVANKLTRGSFTEFLAQRFAVRAVPTRQSGTARCGHDGTN